MSDKQLHEVLAKGDKDSCLAFFQGMSEKMRRKLAPQCQSWFRKVRKNSAPSGPMEAAAIAVFATCNATEIKSLGWQARPNDEIAYDMLLDRRPTWTATWVNSRLDGQYYWGSWPFVRRLIHAGLIKKPDHPNYYLGMISAIDGIGSRNRRPIEKCLMEDDELLQDEVWRLFEYDGVSENSLAIRDRFEGKSSWAVTLISLMKKSVLPRERLIECSLDALDRDFNHYRAKWFATFHDMLKLSPKEEEEVSTRYLHLLGVSSPNIVSWAFKKVEALTKRGVLRPTDLAHGMQPVLESRQKGIVKKAIKLLIKQCQQKKPSVSRNDQESVAIVVTAALAHEAPDVQEVALDAIEKLAPEGNKELCGRIAEYTDIVSPSHRDRVASLSGEQLTSGRDDGGANLNLDAVDELNPELRKLFSIDALVANLENEIVELPCAAFDGNDLPRLQAVKPIEPIDNLEDLIDLCARVVEEPSQVEEFERALDGLSRLCDQRPKNFEQLVAPLKKRITKLLKKDMGPFIGIGPDDDMCGLVYAWCTGTALESVETERNDNTLRSWQVEHEERDYYADNLQKPIGFLTRRSQALARRLAAKMAAPWLSAPTHCDGWIAASELVNRANAVGKEEPIVADVCLALLRLAPEGRKEALQQLKPGKGEWRAAIGYALGKRVKAIGKTASLWIAAARARSPWERDEKVVKAFPDFGPDAGESARLSFGIGLNQWDSTDVITTCDPSLPTNPDPDCVTVTFHKQGVGDGLSWELGGFGGRTTGAVRWTATIWPLGRDSFFAAAAREIAGNLGWWEACWQNKHLLEPLLDPGTPLRQMGLLLLSLGLAAKEPGEHGLAVDVAIRAIEEGRVDAEALGSVLHVLLCSGLIASGRWQKTLGDVAHASAVHALIVQQSLQRCFVDDSGKMPRDFSKLLELLNELTIGLGHSIRHQPCRDFLAQLNGSSKAAKLAKQLSAHEGQGFSDADLQLMQLAIEQRIAAARQWTI